MEMEAVLIQIELKALGGDGGMTGKAGKAVTALAAEGTSEMAVGLFF